MIKIVEYNESMKRIWDEFCNSSKTPMFMFNRGYMDYHSSRFTDKSLMFYDDDNLLCVLPASIENSTLISHGGLTYGGLIQSPSTKQVKVFECINELLDYCIRSKIGEVFYKFIPHIYHVVPSEEDIYSLSRFPYEVYKIEASTVIDLDNPQKISKGRKAQISRAKREGVVIKKCTVFEDFCVFIDLENSVLSERHQTSAVHSAEELFLLYSRFPNNIVLYGGFIGNEMVSAVVLFVYSNAVHTQYMASNEIGRAVGGLDLIVKSIIEEYKGMRKWLDFGISTEQLGTVLNEGLISQKESFGGRTNVYSTWKIDVTKA